MKADSSDKRPGILERYLGKSGVVDQTIETKPENP
jgi:hypothetical protein